MSDQSLDNHNQDDPPSPGRLREMYEAMLKENRELKQSMAIAESGLKLSPRQRRTIIRDLTEDKQQVTAENVLAAAKEYGWDADADNSGTPPLNASGDAPTNPPSTPAPTPGTPPAIDPNTGLPVGATPDELRRLAMTAQFAAAGGMQTHDTAGNEVTFERMMNMMKEASENATSERESTEAQMAIIRKYGGAFGLGDAAMVD